MSKLLNFPEDLGRVYERIVWHSPFYRAICHGLYVAFDDECYDEKNALTKKGEEFLQKKKIRALIVHPRRGKLQSTSTLSVYVRPMKNYQAWLSGDLKVVVETHASIGVLVDVADAQSLVILAVLYSYMKSASIINSVKAVCEAIGGGGLVADSQAQEMLKSHYLQNSRANQATASPLAEDELGGLIPEGLTATEETLRWFSQQEELHDFKDYDMVVQ